jgi:hypothetical protein
MGAEGMALVQESKSARHRVAQDKRGSPISLKSLATRDVALSSTPSLDSN